MVEIKTKISFDEYNAIVDMVTKGCFPDDTYSPVYYELMFRYALFKTFASDYDIPELDATNYNEVWERLTNNDGLEVFYAIHDMDIYFDIKYAIDNAIDYRIKMMTSSPMSMADMALATLFDTINEKVSQIDTSMLTKDNMDIMIQAVNATKDNQFASNLVDTMLDKGLLAKPNRETRRKNIKQNKKNTTESDK